MKFYEHLPIEIVNRIFLSLLKLSNVIDFCPCRAAIRAPSLHTLAKSAPDIPGVRAANFFAQSSIDN